MQSAWRNMDAQESLLSGIVLLNENWMHLQMMSSNS